MIVLQPFNQTHYGSLIDWIDSPETLMQFAGPGFSFPLNSRQLNDSLSDPNRHAFAVMDATSNRHIGHAEIYVTDTSAYLGRILIGDPTLRGKGTGQAIVSLLLNMAFGQLNQSLVQLNVFDWNLPAIRCYEKSGFSINPAKKSERTVNGQKWTALNMLIDIDTWKQLQKEQY